jgi:hypothetical protein
MNAQKIEKVTQGILDRTKLDMKKAHRFALAALTGKCPMCDDVGIIELRNPESETWSTSMSSGGARVEVCPVCVSVEEARQ